ncbi:hypothetical protein IMZ38_04035 [Thermosphaera chiliense]|uniref:Uncharacterized protein n=1 Tax=Thermosphaera chiliense TaxID=3402707 RepID=A0A7M1UNM4_9CREN|nr:hypothetical protein [Thermosphaera aggregans]QOR93830.1 hypothetical protein IMZ38_04035 [Thermosphaera aggregans]
MSLNDLPLILNKTFNGDLYIDFRNTEVKLGGNINQKVTIPIGLPNRSFTPLQLAILDMIVQSQDNRIDWKVKVNGVNITKEFKPLFTAKTDSAVYSKFVFDITSILNTEESMSRNWVNVTIKHEGGTGFSIKTLLLLSIYESEDGRTSLEYRSGLVRLRPGERFNISKGEDEPYSNVKIVYGSMSKDLITTVHIGDRIIRLGIHNDFEEYEFTREGKQPVFIQVEESVNSSKTKEVFLANVISYNSTLKAPFLVGSLDSVRMEGRELVIDLSLKNTGESAPDSVVYTILHKGQAIYTSKDVERIDPQMLVNRKIHVKMPEGVDEATLRIIWRKLTKTWFLDLPISLKKN